jgi:hypothetical protein
MTLTLAEGTPMTSAADILAGRCAAWVLPHTAECAKAARARLKDVLLALGLATRVTDSVTMVSELATNAWLHGLRGLSLDDRHAPAAGRSELAVYRRGPENAAELVVTVFDPRPGLAWISEQAANPLAGPVGERRDERLSAAEVDKLLGELPDQLLPESAEVAQGLHPGRWSGQRGLATVRELSGGRCGFYRTTSRLGAGPASGKAAWFAIPLDGDSFAAWPPQATYSSAGATAALRSQLQARGAPHMIQTNGDDRSVLSLPHATVWVDSAGLRWRSDPRAVDVWLPHTDLAEAVERLVQINEDRAYSSMRPCP